MSLTVPTAIAALLPLFATMLSSYLNDDKFAPGINALIALIALLVAATACELLAGNITGNWSVSFLGVLGYVGVLMSGDLGVLFQYLVAKPSPLAGPPPATTYQPPKPITFSPAAGGSTTQPPTTSASPTPPSA